MKKYMGIIVLLVIFFLFFYLYASENNVELNSDNLDEELADYVEIKENNPIYYLKNGWHIVPSTTKENDTEWAYYEENKELIRVSELIYVHRGWGDAPENSLEAIKMTKEHGYYGVEIDIRFTKDHIPILCHDSKIDRVAIDKQTGKKANDVRLRSKSYQELSNDYIFNITSGGEILQDYSDNTITKFEDALKYIKENKMTVQFDLKEPFENVNLSDEEKETRKTEIKRIVEMVQENDMDNVVMWSSAYYHVLEVVKDCDDNEILRYMADDTVTKDEINERYGILKTDYNIVKIKSSYGDTDKIIHFRTPNVSSNNESEFPISNFMLNTIPQGKITVRENNIILNNNIETIAYTYDGDGIVKCTSSDINYVTCSVNNEKKEVVITPKQNIDKAITISLIASQGVNYSISNEEIINCNFELIYSNDINTSINNYKIIIKIPYNYVLTVEELNKKIAIIGENSVFKDANDSIVTNSSTILGTGSKIILANNEYEIIINGDINKDGKITSLDYIAIRKHLLKEKIINTSEIEFIAADTNEDNKISALDYINIRKIMMLNTMM